MTKTMTDVERTITVTADAAAYANYRELAAVLFKAAEWSATGRWGVLDTWNALTDEQRERITDALQYYHDRCHGFDRAGDIVQACRDAAHVWAGAADLCR